MLQLSPSELGAAVRAASQGANVGDLRMWRSFAEATLFHAGQLKPKQMAFITNGFARATVPDRDVFRRLADSAMEQVHEFEPRDIALFLNAYAKLQFRDLGLFECFAKAISSGDSIGYGEQQLSLVANAYARLELGDVGLFKVLGVWISKRVAEFTPQGVAAVANAYAKVLMRDVELFAALGSNMERLLPRLDPRAISNLLNAYARLQIKDQDVLQQLVGLVPSRVHDFGAVEVAATANAITKLGIHNHRTFLALATTIKERSAEFRSRQLAQVIHAFSTLTVTYGRLLMDLSPQVLASANMADDQSLVLLFCAYARAGQPSGQAIQALVELLLPRVQSLDVQVQVQLFYACGRLALRSEPLTHALAAALLASQRRRHGEAEPTGPPSASTGAVAALAPQHVANCLFAAARLNLCSDEVAGLTDLLQARLARGDMDFEPQQSANVLHALAALHGVGAEPGTCAQVVTLPANVVPAMVNRVLKERRWAEQPRLLASAAVSCARLRHSSTPMFSLASRTVREARCTLSKQGVADLLAAFSVTQLFDLDLFVWALTCFSPNAPGSTPMAPLLMCLGALDYANHVFTGSEEVPLTAFPDNAGSASEAGETALLFPSCPRAFQHQALEFYRHVGLSLLMLAQTLPVQTLTDLAVPFARAGLLPLTPPFDLLEARGPAWRAAMEAADDPPNEPLSSPLVLTASPLSPRRPPRAQGTSGVGSGPNAEAAAPEDEDLADESPPAWSEQHAPHGDTVLDFLLGQLASPLPMPPCSPSSSSSAPPPSHSSSSSSSSSPSAASVAAVAAAERLARYAAMLPRSSSASRGRRRGTLDASGTLEGSDTFGVAAAVLDPLLRQMGTQLAAMANELPFSDLVVALTTLLQAGVCPRSSLDALLLKAERTFPVGSVGQQDFAAVATLCRGLAAASETVVGGSDDVFTPGIRSKLVSFAEGFGASGKALDLGNRPLRDLASLLAALQSVGEVEPSLIDTLLVVALDCPGGLLQEAYMSDELEDLSSLLSALMPLAAVAARAASGSQVMDGASRPLVFDTIDIVTARLAQLLAAVPAPWTSSSSSSSSPSSSSPPLAAARVAELVAAVAEAPGNAPRECFQPGFVAALAERVAASSQELGPAGLCDCLYAFARLGLLTARAGGGELERLATALARARAASAPEQREQDGGLLVALRQLDATGSEARLRAALVAAMRGALVWQRRLGTTQAAQTAFFCTLALDSPCFSDSERDEARKGLSQLLEQLCWQRQKWSAEDRRLAVAVGALLRAEFPELLRGGPGGLSRSVREALAELRRSCGAGGSPGLEEVFPR